MEPMGYTELRRYCRALVSDVGLSPPLDPVIFCQRLSDSRGRMIKLFPREIPVAAAVGVLMATNDRDLITYQAATTLAHQGHIIYHEVIHLLRDHVISHGALTCGGLLPEASAESGPPLPRRSLYEDWQEWEAETGATILSEWSHWSPQAGAGVARSTRARRLYAALDDPVWD
jgi:hypothetical protein